MTLDEIKRSIAAKDPRYITVFSNLGEPPESGVVILPCRYRGPLVPLENRYKLNLGVLRNWYPCKKGHGINGYVCPCEGCTPHCSDYLASEDV